MALPTSASPPDAAGAVPLPRSAAAQPPHHAGRDDTGSRNASTAPAAGTNAAPTPAGPAWTLGGSLLIRLRLLFHLLVLCCGTALSTHGLLQWRLAGFDIDSPSLLDPAMQPIALLAVGVALVPVSLFEIFQLDSHWSKRARRTRPRGQAAP